MPRTTARLTDALRRSLPAAGALRGRKAVVLAGAAAALAGAAGTASAATLTAAAPAPAHGPHAAAAASHHPTPVTPPHRAATTAAVRRAARHRAGPVRPYEIYDSVTPAALPAGHPIATYADGSYAASPAQLHGRHVLWIDTNGSDPKANALDVEPGDATPAQAATWAAAHLHAHPASPAIIYTMRSDWPAAQQAIAGLPGWMQHQVRWWIADPTGVPHIVPGANATQWYWGSSYDITTASPTF
jgi:hypothetical protein